MIIIEVIYFMESLYDGHPTICTFGRHKEFSLFQVIEFAEECLILRQQCSEYHFQVYRLVLATIELVQLIWNHGVQPIQVLYSVGLQDGEKTIEHFFKFTIAMPAEFTESIFKFLKHHIFKQLLIIFKHLTCMETLPQEGY